MPQPMEFREATERAFTGTYADNKARGVYACICCGKALFDSSAKFDSGTGWPSYFQLIGDDAIGTKVDGISTDLGASL